MKKYFNKGVERFTKWLVKTPTTELKEHEIVNKLD